METLPVTLLSPDVKVQDRRPANNASATRPVLGPTVASLDIHSFGRLTSLAPVVPFVPRAYSNGASTAEPWFLPREE